MSVVTGRPKIKAVLLSLVVFLICGLAVATASFFAVIFLAGPHGGVLPEWTQGIVLLIAWVITIGVPVFCAVKTYRKFTNHYAP